MAARYWVGGGSSTNWNATGNTNWGTTSGVQDNASVPTSVDDVIFDGAGVAGNSNCTVNTALACLTLTITSGYTATMTHNGVLTITTTWNFSNTYIIAGSSSITLSGTNSITAGQTWPNSITFSNTNTKTLHSDLVVSGSVSISGAGTTTLNGASYSMSCNGLATGSAILTGTAKVIITGGTWSGTNTTGTSNNLDLQGNVTVSGNVYYKTGTLTYVSGTITFTSSILNITGSCTLNTNGMSWGGINFSVASTVTLTSNLTATATTISAVSIINRTTSETWSTSGINCILGVTGTAKIILTGGTWSASTNRTIENNLDLQGNVTVSGTVYYSTGTMTYVSGTITVTSSTLRLNGTSCTMNTNGMSWNDLATSCITTTLTSNLSISGTLTVTNTNGVGFNKTTSETVTCNGFSLSRTIGGTANVYWIGGTWTDVLTTGGISSNLFIQGNVTLSGTVRYVGGTMTYVSGTVTVSGSTLLLIGSATLDTTGTTFNIVQVNATGFTLTLNSTLSADTFN